MECKDTKGNEKRGRRRKKSFIEALKEKYIVEDEPKFNFIVVSPKRKNNTAELGHLRAVALNEMDVTRADIPQQGLTSLCPNVVDLDLANNLLEKWSELLVILSHLPKLRYVNVSRNKLQLDNMEVLSERKLPVENLALNDTGMPVEDVVRLSQIMPTLKELHLCDNNYEDLADIEKKIKEGAFSTLECLRLNNNELSSWSEVWKLRHLPHLKYLILSGNPVSDVFYSTEVNTEVSTEDSQPEAASATECQDSSGVDVREEGQMSAPSCPCSGSDTDLVEGESGLDADFCLVLDKTEESDEVLLDSLDNGDEGEEAEEDFDWSNDVTRPVSRFGRHTESECSTECSSERGGGGSESDEPMSTQAYEIFSMSPHEEPSDSNYNNSRRRNHYADPWSDSAFPDMPFDDFVLEDFADTEGHEGHATDDDNAEAEDWHRRAAETFLFDIIENLTFEGPSLNQGNVCQQLDSRTEASVKGESSNTGAERIFMSARCSAVDFSGRDQLQCLSGVKKSESGEVTPSTHQDILSATHGWDTESSETISLFGNCMQTEADFIPRAVSMLDEDELTSFLQSRLACPAPSRAQRALFQEPCLNSNNNKCSRPHRHDSTHSCAEPQCRANVCSQCEAGQDRCQDRLHGSHLSHDENGGKTDTQSVQSTDKLENLPQSKDRLEESVDKTESHSPHVAGQSPRPCDVTDESRDGVDSTSQPPLLPSLDVSRPTTQDHSEGDGSSSSQPPSNSLSSQDPQPTCQHHLQQQQQQETADNTCDVDTPDQAQPFQQLQILCLSNANLQEWRHLQAFSFFPKLNNIRLKSNPLYSNVHPDDRRKLYIASLPRVSVLNGSEVSNTEREKAENFYLRYFMDKEDKPDFYHTLVKKHGPPVKLVDIDLSAGYHEWANLRFMWNGVEKFTRKIHLVEPVGKLRAIISQTLGLPKRCFIMYHYLCGPSHPESERELIELRCESLPMSRFDFAEGDEIHIDVQD